MRRIIAVFTLAAMLGLAAPVLAMGPVASPFDGPPSKVRVGVPPAAEKSFGDPTDYFASLLAGADYLVKMQADITEDNAGNGSSDADPDDGGWDWVTTLFVHSSSSSSTNLYGVTALGILGAYNLDPQPARFIALKDAADHIVSVGPAVIRSGPDVIFLLRFANLPDCPDPAYYRAGAQAIWDRDISVYVTMAALAAYIRDIRYAQGYSNGIIPWDIAFWVEAAMLMEETFPGAGHAAEAAAMAEVIYQDSFAGNPGYFDPDGANMGSDPTGETAIYWCYTLGLAGIIDAFAVSGTHTAELPALQTLLLACQYADGAFSEQYGATDLVNDRHWQSTAYAMMALYENLPVATTTLTALRSAAAWSISTQDDTGAWVSDSGYHYPEVGAENTSALVDALLAGNNVACVPDPRNLNIASPTGEVVVKYLGGASAPLFGFSIEVLWDPAVASATIARPDAGLFNNPTYFIPTPITSGALVGFRVDAALQGTETGILLGDLFKLTFTRVADGYGTTPIDITLLAMRDNLNADLLGLSEDDGLVVVDGTAPTVTNTFIANATLSHTDDYIKNTDHAVVTATVGDDDLTFGIANIRADLTVLGGGASVAPDGYELGVATWDVPSATCLPTDGLIDVTVTAIDPLGNSASDSDGIIADNTLPAALADLAATPGHQKVNLTWTDGYSALPTDYYGTQICFRRWTGYPTYATGEPGYPENTTTPGDGTALNVTGSVSAVTHSLPLAADRDIYYYGGFVYDIALNYSPAAANARATCYWLGDVCGASLGDLAYNGKVDVADINVFGYAYGLSPLTSAYDECDVGPTHNRSRVGIPLPDGVVNFEDLMIFAMNFGVVSKAVPAGGGLPVLSWTRVDDTTWALTLDNSCSALQGLRLRGDLPDGVVAQVAPGALIADQHAPFFLKNAGGLDAGLALLGTNTGFAGRGELLRVTLPADVSPTNVTITARSVANEDLGTTVTQPDVTSLPRVFALAQNVPNPFNPMTKISFALPVDTAVRLRVFGVDGRLVRTLIDDLMAAGNHDAIWDGRNDTGRRVASGTYFCRIEAGEDVQTRKMSLMK